MHTIPRKPPRSPGAGKVVAQAPRFRKGGSGPARRMDGRSTGPPMRAVRSVWRESAAPSIRPPQADMRGGAARGPGGSGRAGRKRAERRRAAGGLLPYARQGRRMTRDASQVLAMSPAAKRQAVAVTVPDCRHGPIVAPCAAGAEAEPSGPERARTRAAPVRGVTGADGADTGCGACLPPAAADDGRAPLSLRSPGAW